MSSVQLVKTGVCTGATGESNDTGETQPMCDARQITLSSPLESMLSLVDTLAASLPAPTCAKAARSARCLLFRGANSNGGCQQGLMRSLLHVISYTLAEVMRRNNNMPQKRNGGECQANLQTSN